MRIAIMLLNRGRGSGEVARQHARELLRLGHEVVFMHPGVGAGVAGSDNVDVTLPSSTTPVHEYLPSAKDGQKAVSTMTLDQAMSYVPAYEQALAGVIEEVDVVVGHHANLVAIAVHRVASKHGKPYALFLHGTGIEPRKHGGYDDCLWGHVDEAIQAANGILVTTEYVRDELVRPVVDLPLDRFLILPCGIDLEEQHPDNVGDVIERYELPETFVICPGALTAVKGPQNVVRASETYGHLAPTIFIGDGDMRSELERTLGERGRVLGFVSTEDKAQLINAASLLVAAPEKLEHFGIIYTEALAGGTVPIAYRGGGVDTIVTPEVGVLTERQPQALGEATHALLEAPERVAALAQNARARAEAKFGARELAKRLEQWLVTLAATPR